MSDLLAGQALGTMLVPGRELVWENRSVTVERVRATHTELLAGDRLMMVPNSRLANHGTEPTVRRLCGQVRFRPGTPGLFRYAASVTRTDAILAEISGSVAGRPPDPCWLPPKHSACAVGFQDPPLELG